MEHPLDKLRMIYSASNLANNTKADDSRSSDVVCDSDESRLTKLIARRL